MATNEKNRDQADQQKKQFQNQAPDQNKNRPGASSMRPSNAGVAEDDEDAPSSSQLKGIPKAATSNPNPLKSGKKDDEGCGCDH